MESHPYTPSSLEKFLQELLTPSEKPPTSDPLTQREVEVLRLVAQGYENKEIAEKAGDQ